MAQKKSLHKRYVQKTIIKKQGLPQFRSIQFLILYLRTFTYSIMLMRQVQKHFQQIKFLHMISSKPAPMEMLIMVRILRISAGWIISDDVIVHKSSLSVMLPERNLFYRKAIGYDCKLYYDGQEDLLFNLDNHHLFYYDMLSSYHDRREESTGCISKIPFLVIMTILISVKTLSLKLLHAAMVFLFKTLDLHTFW